MRILFVPHHAGGLSHVIPLVALNNALADSSIKTAFLVSSEFHEILKQAGANVLSINHSGFRTEMVAYGEFSPHLVVDDASIFTGLTTALSGLPRIAIQRTGMFAGTVPRNKAHRHSSSTDMDDMFDVTVLGLPQPQTFSDLFEAEAKLVPGIRSIELLPEVIKHDESYFFSGPLLMPDLLVGQLYLPQQTPATGPISSESFRDFDSLQRFFDFNKNRRIVYLTFGLAAKAGEPLFECMRYLLESGIAIISSIRADDFLAEYRDSYFCASYLPMHFVCSNVDLAIHHCGSGTYHYPIIHNLPTITIGTRCYDRDDVAVVLQELGVSVHLPAPDECNDFIEQFKATIEKYFDPHGNFMQEKKDNLVPLRIELERASSEFDFHQVIEYAMRAPRKRDRRLIAASRKRNVVNSKST